MVTTGGFFCCGLAAFVACPILFVVGAWGLATKSINFGGALGFLIAGFLGSSVICFFTIRWCYRASKEAWEESVAEVEAERVAEEAKSAAKIQDHNTSDVGGSA
jgi:hypothetical protein